MKAIVGILALGVLVTGCATNGSVKKQIAPLESRLSAVEKQQGMTAATEAKLADLNTKMDAQAAELAALKKDVAASTAAASEAQAAAARAEQAAQKSAKAFDLSQKGAKK